MADVFCDICGRGPVRAQIMVEGAKLIVCGACMGSGKVLQRFHEDEAGAPVMETPKQVLEMGGEDGYQHCGRIDALAKKLEKKRMYRHHGTTDPRGAPIEPPASEKEYVTLMVDGRS